MRIIVLALNLAFGSIPIVFDLVEHSYVGNHGGWEKLLEIMVVEQGGR